MVVALTAMVLLGALAIGPVHASTKSELDAAKANLNVLLGKINAENATISTLQSQANAIVAQIDKVQTRIAKTQGQIVNLEQDIRAAEGQLLGAQQTLDHRAWVAYEVGPGSNIEFLLGSTSLSDLTDRLEIVNHVAQSDADLIQQIHDQQNLLAAKTASLQGLQVQLQSQKSDLSKQEKAIVDHQAAAQSLLNALNMDKAAADALVKKLGAQHAAELRAAELARRAAQGVISGVFFACPVDQPRAYADDFGAPRYSGGFHLHAGNDIVAPRGTPIRAPFPGTATQSANDLGGLAVIVTGSAGYVYN